MPSGCCQRQFIRNTSTSTHLQILKNSEQRTPRSDFVNINFALPFQSFTESTHETDIHGKDEFITAGGEP